MATFMDIDKLPQREFLSCVDIVYFPVFASWIKSSAGDDDSPEILQTRVKFVGLLLHIAFKLYKPFERHKDRPFASHQDTWDLFR